MIHVVRCRHTGFKLPQSPKPGSIDVVQDEIAHGAHKLDLSEQVSMPIAATRQLLNNAANGRVKKTGPINEREN